MRALLACGLAVGLAAGPAQAGPARADPAVAALDGWSTDDHRAALKAFAAGCRQAPSDATCRAALRITPADGAAARLFFETRFEPVPVDDRGFLTAYFEPEFAGSLRPDTTYRYPLLGRPRNLVVIERGPRPEGWPDGMTAALRTPAGLAALPDRAAIEDGALGPSAAPIVYLADPVDAFNVQVQGSARIRLPGGRAIRVGFDGRNGHPYTAIARVLAEQEGMRPADLTADRLWAWLKAHPDRAPAIMRANRSFIFFRRLPERTGGPVGAAGIPLTPGRSLAVDRGAWPYGTLVWLEGELPQPGGGRVPLRRLLVAQDTGAAIVGRARGDLFVGSGEAAGRLAGLVRDPVRWVVLRPKPAAR